MKQRWNAPLRMQTCQPAYGSSTELISSFNVKDKQNPQKNEYNNLQWFKQFILTFFLLIKLWK